MWRTSGKRIEPAIWLLRSARNIKFPHRNFAGLFVILGAMAFNGAYCFARRNGVRPY